MRRISVLLAALLAATPVAAQILGNGPSGGVVANSGASSAPAAWTTPTAWLDRWCSGVAGQFPVRNASWGCVTLSGDVTMTGTGAVTIANNAVTTVKILNNAVDNTKLRDSGPISVIGRTANSSGDPADISCTAASDAVLRESGSTLGCGTVVAGGIASNAVTTPKVLDANVTYAKIQNAGALSLLGRSVNSSGVLADISATAASSCAYRESGSTIACGTLATAAYAANSVTNPKLAQMANATTKCRTTAGTGDPEDCTAAQVAAIVQPSFTAMTVQVITSTGTYTAPAAVLKVLAYVKGGGGGGGGSSSATANGGGGGEGAESWAMIARASITGQTCTIGAGGTSVAINTNAAGGNGASTTIGAVIGAGGGAGGASGNNGGQGGSGGSMGTRDWGMPGSIGYNGSNPAANIVLAAGGGGKGGGQLTAAGVANSGGGGGGGTTAVASGVGGSGICVFMEYYN